MAEPVPKVTKIPRSLDVKAPLEVARAFLVDQYGVGSTRHLHFWRGDFFAWRGSHYEVAPSELIRSRLYAYLSLQRDINGQAIKPTRRLVDDVLDALRAAAFLNVAQAPIWLTTDEPAPAASSSPVATGSSTYRPAAYCPATRASSLATRSRSTMTPMRRSRRAGQRFLAASSTTTPRASPLCRNGSATC